MLRDITLGQYIPGDSALHRMDARVKILVTLGFTVILFVAVNLGAVLAAGLLPIIAAMISRISAKIIIKSFKPLLPFILFTVILNLFYVGGDPIVQFWIFKITWEGLHVSAIMTLRIIFMLIGGSLLTFTTSPILLTDAIERLMGPMKKIKVPVHEIAMMMTIALRFIPTLIEETDKIMNAQKARGADMERGSVLQRIRALIPILIPLFVSAFKRADELALAMESRCYTGGEGRTRMKVMKMSLRDIWGVLLWGVSLTLVILCNNFFGNAFG